MQFRLSDVAAATDGVLHGADVRVDGATIDSRGVLPGALFVPIVATRDGHDFIDAAMEAGAAAHLTERPAGDHPAVRVRDTEAALRSLGGLARASVQGHVVGVTGSVGKTTTKDFIEAALTPTHRIHASYRSFNNELGVPLTLMNAPASVDVVVVEMGARGPGHIAELCEIARPTIGVVTAVGAAHTEMFGDLDGVARAKGELIEALPSDGTAVLNADDDRVLSMRERSTADVVTFGRNGDVRATNLALDDMLRPTFTLESPWGSHEVTLAGAGVHMVANALAAAAVALVVGADPASVARGLAVATISPWRMEVTRSRSGALVINDAYNANPLSMHAAIDALLSVPVTRRVAVIGTMAELGEDAAAMHAAVGHRLRLEAVDVVAVGTDDYGVSGVATVADAAERIGDLTPDTAVLIKGSRVAGLEELVDLLD